MSNAHLEGRRSAAWDHVKKINPTITINLKLDPKKFLEDA